VDVTVAVYDFHGLQECMADVEDLKLASGARSGVGKKRGIDGPSDDGGDGYLDRLLVWDGNMLFGVTVVFGVGRGGNASADIVETLASASAARHGNDKEQ
jgi:hypothetical protein